MKQISTLLSFTFLFFISCNSNNDENIEEITNIIYDIPFSISPDNSSIFYSHEQFTISWELPDELNNSEIQILESSNPIDTSDNSIFENLPINGYGGQTSHIFSYLEDPNNPISETIYIGYRIRAKDLELETGYSEWTEIKTFKILPLINLDKQTVIVSYDFNFITVESNNEYYSGIVEKVDYKLSDIATENNLNLERIKVVRPISVKGNFQTLTNDGQNPFHPITFGYNDSIEQNDSVYPFDPLGQIFPGSYEESPVQAQLYNQQYINLNNDMRTYNLKMAYLLIDNPNSEHQVQLNFEFDIYLD